MTSRQSQTLRRQAERKLAKLARKAENGHCRNWLWFATPQSNQPQPSRDGIGAEFGFVSQKRMEANRANAQLSTGPRCVSQNTATSAGTSQFVRQ